MTKYPFLNLIGTVTFFEIKVSIGSSYFCSSRKTLRFSSTNVKSPRVCQNIISQFKTWRWKVSNLASANPISVYLSFKIRRHISRKKLLIVPTNKLSRWLLQNTREVATHDLKIKIRLYERHKIVSFFSYNHELDKLTNSNKSRENTPKFPS